MPSCVFCSLGSFCLVCLIHNMHVEDKSHSIPIQHNTRLFGSGGDSSFETEVICVF